MSSAQCCITIQPMNRPQTVLFSEERPVSPAVAEQRVVLHGIRWQTYEDLLTQNEGNSGVHFAYDQGKLEIMTLSPRHELLKHALALLVEVLAEEFAIDVIGFGSTTFRRSDLERGFEPDACFYIAQADQVQAKESIDLNFDPPPDLVIEIDISHPSLNKFPIFHALGVPEIWRYDGELVTIYRLQGNDYMPQRTSLAFPLLTTQLLTEWMEINPRIKRTEWLRQIRAWARAIQEI